MKCDTMSLAKLMRMIDLKVASISSILAIVCEGL